MYLHIDYIYRFYIYIRIDCYSQSYLFLLCFARDKVRLPFSEASELVGGVAVEWLRALTLVSGRTRRDDENH